jgi:hypothetical protein
MAYPHSTSPYQKGIAKCTPPSRALMTGPAAFPGDDS